MKSAYLHHDEGEIVVLLRVADPVVHFGGNARADLISREMSGFAKQLLQALFPELFVLGVVGLGDAVGISEKDIAAVQLASRFFVARLREHADDGAPMDSCSIAAGAEPVVSARNR